MRRTPSNPISFFCWEKALLGVIQLGGNGQIQQACFPAISVTPWASKPDFNTLADMHVDCLRGCKCRAKLTFQPQVEGLQTSKESSWGVDFIKLH